MDFTCGNCKNRHSWDCEDYNWGFWDARACSDHFELDIDTLSPKQRESITNIAKEIISLEKW